LLLFNFGLLFAVRPQWLIYLERLADSGHIERTEDGVAITVSRYTEGCAVVTRDKKMRKVNESVAEVGERLM